jgi:anti-sigma factor RsiW
MPNINERPVCHRAEDLVTYLYGEASELDAKDFAIHLQQCEACRSEFGVFQQVHESIGLWRNEALGSAFKPAVLPVESVGSTQFVPQRKLPALAALREFFSVSPLWLRAATAFAALLLCAMVLLIASRSWNRTVDNQAKYTQQQFDEAVKKRVEEQTGKFSRQQTPPPVNDAAAIEKPTGNGTRSQITVSRIQPKTSRPQGLSRQEREELAKDLRLIPRDEDELPFVLSDEPDQ